MRLAVGVEGFERLARAAMELHAAGDRKAVVDRVADEDVREAQAVAATRYFADDALRHGFVEDCECVGRRFVREPGEFPDTELTAQYRCEDEKVPTLVGKAPQAVLDDAAHGVRNAQFM